MTALKNYVAFGVVCFSFFISSYAQAYQTAGAHTYATRYNPAGQVVGTIAPDPDGGGPLKYPATRNTYNTAGVLIKSETGELSGWATETEEPKNWVGFTVVSSVTFAYDSFGRKTHQTTFDKNGAPIALVQTNFDAGDHVKCKAVRMNPSVYSALPDACAQSTNGAHGPDRISQFEYDALDQVTLERRAYANPLVQTYVKNTYEGRRLKTQTDANGNLTEMRYDANFKWLTRQVYPSLVTKGAVNEADYVEFSNRDLNGNIRTERKRSGDLIGYEFDANNRKIKKTLPDTNQNVTYTFDLRGLALKSTFFNGQGITNVFDGFGNLKTSTTSMGGVLRAINYQYDENGNRWKITHPDGNYFTYGFDGLNRVTSVAEGTSTAMLLVNYNNDGRRLNITRPGGATTGYQFTNGLQLNQFSQTFNDPAYNLVNSFVYNPASQITQLTINNGLYSYIGNQNRTGIYVPNNLNQYKTINGQALTYDNNANLATDSGNNYYYDYENRLISTSGAVSSSFKYDPLGRLHESIINGVQTQYLYDGDALIAEYQSSQGSMLRRYIHGDQVDEPWLQYSGASIGASFRRYLHADHQGSVIAHSNASGGVFNTLAYDGFGIPAATNVDRFGYTGQIAFKELGLNYYKARFYAPKLGRFLQTDPIGYKDQMNLYTYVGNDPLNKLDSTGKYGELVVEAVSIGMGVNSFSKNLSSGNYSAAAVDAAGVVADGAMAAIPIAPGVAGMAINSARTGEKILSNSDNVVRGGTNTAERFSKGSGVTTSADGTLNGVSVNSAPGATVEQLSKGIPNGQVGATTVGDIRAAGGDVTPSPTNNNPNHCTMCGITPQKAEELFNPTINNPSR